MTPQSTEAVLATRGRTHGDFRHQFAMSRSLKSVFSVMFAQQELSEVQKEVLDMFAVKLSRAATGNVNEPDHWLDISGYAALAAKEATEKQLSTKLPEQPDLFDSARTPQETAKAA